MKQECETQRFYYYKSIVNRHCNGVSVDFSAAACNLWYPNTRKYTRNYKYTRN